MIPASSPFWPWTGAWALLLFWAGAVPMALCARQKRFRFMLWGLPLEAASYFILQCSIKAIYQNARQEAVRTAVNWFAGVPPYGIMLMLGAVLAGIGLMLWSVSRYERRQITPMSVKEAVDSLPSGVCVYLPGGRVIMINRAMEQFCRMAAGGPLINGEDFRNRLLRGDLLPGCQRVMAENTPVIMLPDGTAWSVHETEAPYAHTHAHRLLISDATEMYHKTQSLQKMQETLSALNRRLTAYNQEIVGLTAQKELLEARVRLHDQMGEDLLTMKRYIQQGGTQMERRDIESMLRRNITFLKTGQQQARRDEYELILETAEKLGVHVRITGRLPETEPDKHIIATAIHECFTNTLRHAHGSTLFVHVREQDGRILAVFTNNGEPPREPIREKGGLSSLRALTEQAGGSMVFSSDPVFSMTLSLPKEVFDGLQSIDRG